MTSKSELDGPLKRRVEAINTTAAMDTPDPALVRHKYVAALRRGGRREVIDRLLSEDAKRVLNVEM